MSLSAHVNIGGAAYKSKDIMKIDSCTTCIIKNTVKKTSSKSPCLLAQIG